MFENTSRKRKIQTKHSWLDKLNTKLNLLIMGEIISGVNNINICKDL